MHVYTRHALSCLCVGTLSASIHRAYSIGRKGFVCRLHTTQIIYANTRITALSACWGCSLSNL